MINIMTEYHNLKCNNYIFTEVVISDVFAQELNADEPVGEITQ